MRRREVATLVAYSILPPIALADDDCTGGIGVCEADIASNLTSTI